MFQLAGFPAFACLALLLFGITAIFRHLSHPLRDVPGPFITRFTRLWYLLQVRGGAAPKELIRQHSKYGKIVRIAPNQYSIDDPEAIKVIYGRGSAFPKSEFYSAFGIPGIDNIFITRSIDYHTQNRKKFHGAYTMSTMTTYEHYVDECVDVFMCKLRDIAKLGSTVNMSQWLQFFAFDVIGCITGSKRFGCLDKGADHDALIENILSNFTYASQMGLYPELHIPFFKALGFLTKIGIVRTNFRSYLRQWITELAQEKTRLIKGFAYPSASDDDIDQGPKDFATKFVEYHEQDPQRFTYTDVLNGLAGNINAGSDTTSASLSSIVYHLYSSPEKLQKLREGLHKGQQQGTLSNPITFKETQQLEYLQAVIKESMRLIPAVAMPLARTVPDGGAEICGRYFPVGTVVGIHAWVAHQNTEVFGSDAAQFRPERWLKNETNEAQLAKMEHYFLSWGLGARTCLGRNVATLEMSKVIPEIVKRFDFEMAQELREAGELVTDAKFLVKPRNLWMRVHVREEDGQ